MEYTSKRHKEMSLVCLNVARSYQGRAKRGTFGRGPLYHIGHLVTWVGCSHLFVGVLRQQENVKF